MINTTIEEIRGKTRTIWTNKRLVLRRKCMGMSALIKE
jgi:hypothetical protein